jgi:PRC-barrel domain
LHLASNALRAARVPQTNYLRVTKALAASNDKVGREQTLVGDSLNIQKSKERRARQEPSVVGSVASFLQPGGRAMASETRETSSLIGSDKVEGTAVYGVDDTKIGSIERVMIDKMSGKVSYAVLSFGGFLGIGDDYYPLPWQSLKYDTNLGGYRTGITEKQLKGAPKYGNDNAWNWSDPARTRSVNDYYGVAS